LKRFRKIFFYPEPCVPRPEDYTLVTEMGIVYICVYSHLQGKQPRLTRLHLRLFFSVGLNWLAFVSSISKTRAYTQTASRLLCQSQIDRPEDSTRSSVSFFFLPSRAFFIVLLLLVCFRFFLDGEEVVVVHEKTSACGSITGRAKWNIFNS
jgi:hypothetical protein